MQRQGAAVWNRNGAYIFCRLYRHRQTTERWRVLIHTV